MFAILLGGLVASATPTVTPSAPKRVITTPAPRRVSPPDMAAMLKTFDTMFPPQPAPDPARLVLAHTTALALLPPDALGKSMGGMMGGMFERLLDLRESELPGAKKGASTATLHQTLVAKDPYFDERMRLTRAAVTTEFMRLSAIIEPRMRDGIARTVARRFDQRQLADINAFFATPSGKALGSQFLGLWFDPDLMRSTFAAMPEVVQLMPGAMERISAATAHLPKPPKPAKPTPPKAAPGAKPGRP
jgi:hypothetical protein